MTNTEFVKRTTERVFLQANAYFSRTDEQWTEMWIKESIAARFHIDEMPPRKILGVLEPYLGSPMDVWLFGTRIQDALDALFQDVYDEVYACMCRAFGDPK